MLTVSMFRRAVLASALALGALQSAHAQAPAPAASAAPPTLAEFFKRGDFREVHISPDGKNLAVTSTINGRYNLVVIDIDARKATALTSYDNIDVGSVRWMNNEWLTHSSFQVGAPSGVTRNAGGLFAVSRDGKRSRQLVQTARQLERSERGGFFEMVPIAMLSGSKDEMIARAVVANDDSYDLYRVNLESGRYRLLTQGRPSDRLGTWILDSKQVPRVAVARTSDASNEDAIHYRPSADAPWRVIAKSDGVKGPAFVPLAFDTDDKTLYVSTNMGRKNLAIYKYDPDAQKLGELVAQHPQYDLGASPQGESSNSLLFGIDASEDEEKAKPKLVGVRVDADRLETLWLDAERQKIQATLDRALPNRTNTFRGSMKSKRFVVESYSDTSPGRVFLFDQEKSRIEEIGATNPWLEGKLAQVRSFMLKTRDGLEIPSYYILPRDYKPGTKLPTIVHIHGGPMARDIEQGGRFGYSFGSREGQILASRGYAVVIPNFRITPELGSSIYYAGFGTYGRQMLDDHEDAVKWAVDQGFADPKRVCISGASYGGYAALQSLVRPSNPFACSISGLPVTDLKFQREEADYAESKSAVNYWMAVMGVKSLSDPRVQEDSPLFHADKIKVPVFMYVGERDTRTPPKQAERMRDALARAGNPVKDYFIGKDEGHGYAVEKTNVEKYERLFRFLEASVGKP